MKMRLAHLLKDFRPGSSDWSWREEFEEIDDRLFSEPILLGSDGRVLDGHHRIRLAVALGLSEVEVTSDVFNIIDPPIEEDS